MIEVKNFCILITKTTCTGVFVASARIKMLQFFMIIFGSMQHSNCSCNLCTVIGAAERLHEVQEQLKVAQAKMSENMTSALKKKEEVNNK